MKRIFLVGAFLVPAVVSAQTPLRRQVDSLHAAMTAAFKTDPSSTARFYTDDAGMVGGGQRIVGREQINGYWSPGMAGATWQLEVLDVGGDASAPWVHGRSSFGRPGGQPFISEFIGLLQRGADQQLRFRIDAYAAWPRTSVANVAKDEADVRALDSLWGRMYAVHDTASALQLYAEQLVFLSPNGRAKTRTQELADVRPAAGLKMEYFRTNPATVRTFEQMAVVGGVAEWRFTMNGSPQEYRRTYTAVYSRGGPLGWRLVALQMGNAP